LSAVSLDSGITAAAAVSLAAVGASLVLASRRRLTLTNLIVGFSSGLIAVQVHGINAFSIAVGLWVLPRVGRQRDSKAALIILAATIPLASTALTGDLVNSTRLAAQLMILAFGASTVCWLADEQDAHNLLRGLLAACSLGSIVAILQVVGLIPSELWNAGDISTLGRPTGIYPEPDWLGMFAAIGGILAWRLPSSSRYREIAFILNFSACVLSFARAAWVGTVGAILLLWVVKIFAGGRFHDASVRRRSIRILATSALIGCVSLVAMPQLRAELVDRASSIVSSSQGDVSGRARLQQTAALNQLASTAPWNGHGLSASGRVGVSGKLYITGTVENNVASNWILGMWVDGKYLSLGLVVLLLLTAAIRTMTVAGQCLVLVLIASLFSNAVFMPITWLLLGLCLSFQRVAVESSLGSRPELESCR
jgi:hypothetical protein